MRPRRAALAAPTRAVSSRRGDDRDAQRPLILAGWRRASGGAAERLTAFAAAHGIPVAHTMTGKGAVPLQRLP
jgi:thiamine pyrophosphate-dependent acetolactate synthase large subunit-like protein